MERLRALRLRAEELDFIIRLLSGAVIVELLSGAVSRGACRQVVGDLGKSRLPGKRPVASSLLELLLVRVATLVGVKRRTFVAIEASSRGCRGVVIRPRELLVLGSSGTGELLLLGSSGRGTTIDRKE